MSNHEIANILMGTAFLAFTAVFVTFTVHARKAYCRLALLAFSALLIASVGFDFGLLCAALAFLGLILLPVPLGIVVAAAMNILIRGIERRHGPTGLTYTVRGTIAGMYRTFWATDH